MRQGTREEARQRSRKGPRGDIWLARDGRRQAVVERFDGLLERSPQRLYRRAKKSEGGFQATLAWG
ncbi:hypothetical protein C4K04_3711 [Pseudomonas chlororaphis]|uniref:Uncharacterized protein n=1 Tax=Pseudomonas chlororaphis TaxID=587753 RepID=A0A3G7TR87_9PSED|nr:hypothetical protein C4K04_3711 [Pseudomonas chlororaphis]